MLKRLRQRYEAWLEESDRIVERRRREERGEYDTDENGYRIVHNVPKPSRNDGLGWALFWLFAIPIGAIIGILPMFESSPLGAILFIAFILIAYGLILLNAWLS